jgi:hypothetical protein
VITRELVEAEAAAGFPRLDRVPSSTVRHFLDYYRELPAAEAATLREALAARGALALQPARGAALAADLAAAYERWTQAKIRAGFEEGARYQPLRLAKNMGVVDDTNAATAAQLRKLIKPVFRDRLGLAGRNERGGNWTYEREDASLKVRVDFGGRTDQLRYAVTAIDAASGRRVAMASYEGLLGLFGGWDWIPEAEAANAVDLLVELVEIVESVPQRG